MSDDNKVDAPDKTLLYPVGSDEVGGCIMLYGKPDASNIAILIPGFANDHSVFLPLAARLAKESDCLAGVICIPGFDDRPEKPWQSHPKDGFTYDEWVNATREAVKTLRGYSTNASAKFTGIFHDFGVIPGLMYTNRVLEEHAASPEQSEVAKLVPDQLIIFDVLSVVHPKTEGIDKLDVPQRSWSYKLWDSSMQLAYKFILAKTWVLQRYISPTFAVFQMSISFLLLGLVGMTPLRTIDVDTVQKDHPVDPFRLAYMAYPYYTLMKAVFGGSVMECLQQAAMPLDLGKTPILYLYGTDKNVHFHPDDALALLERENKEGRRSKAVPIEKAGHYLFLHEPDECFKHVKEYMSSN